MDHYEPSSESGVPIISRSSLVRLSFGQSSVSLIPYSIQFSASSDASTHTDLTRCSGSTSVRFSFFFQF
jgi:hypothetical protein